MPEHPGPHRRHAGERARPLPARAGRHRHHDAGVAVPAADLERPRGVPQPRHADHRRDPRAGADQARRPPGAVDGAARGARRRPAAAHRAVGDAAAARGSRAVSRRAGRPPRAGRRRGATAASRSRRGATPPREIARRVRRRSTPPRRRRARSPSSTPAGARRCSCRSKCRSRTWRGSPSRSTSRAAPPRRARPARRSGPRSIRACSRWCSRTRSTLIFVNSRRVAERLAAALNELAGEPLVRAHHGSLARPQRVEIEDALKEGRLRGLVATSSLELGIDMGAIDLVVQIEAPPSVASGLQRIGRAGHQVGAVSEGLIFPKYRGDLVACAAAARSMHEGLVEATRYPRNPLDVLAQQIVATVGDGQLAGRRAVRDGAAGRAVRRARSRRLRRRARHAGRPLPVRRVRRAAAAHHLGSRARTRSSRREGAQARRHRQRRHHPRSRALRRLPRRRAGRRRARRRARRGDGVREHASARPSCSAPRRGASRTSRTTRCIVSPAPGRARQDAVLEGRGGRPAARVRPRHRRAGPLAPGAAGRRRPRPARTGARPRSAGGREPAAVPRRSAARRSAHVPDDRTIVIERCRDELGDWRVCLLSPLGGQVHRAVVDGDPRAACARTAASTPRRCGTTTASSSASPTPTSRPIRGCCCPIPTTSRRWCCASSARRRCSRRKFREAAARALLLPRRRIGGRTPLWQQRKRAADLLAVASKFGSFPMLLEAYRECLRDVFDMPALIETLRAIRERRLRVVTVDSTTPSPFAASLLFGYVANYLYDGDAPLAERRAQALSIDHAQLQGAARRRRAARAARSRRHRRRRARAAAPRARAPRAHRRRHPRSAAPHRRSHRRGDRDARRRSRRHRRGDRRRWCGRGARCACRSPARRGSSRSRTPAAIATRSARRCRRACRRRCSSRCAIRCSIW